MIAECGTIVGSDKHRTPASVMHARGGARRMKLWEVMAEMK